MPAPLTDADRRAGYVRRDEDGTLLRPGQMTRAESRAWWAENERRCKAWSFGPKPDGNFVRDRWHGWVRAAAKAKGAGK